ncbi:type II toxin-antitoxin system RelE/ParE family toxin [Escherichia coli]
MQRQVCEFSKTPSLNVSPENIGFPINRCAKSWSRPIRGIISANLGSGVIKQRLARSGGGKSGGYRTIIFYRVAEKAFFIYAYAKNERENITAIEENAFRKAAPHVLNLTDEQLAQLIQQGQFTEVPNE